LPRPGVLQPRRKRRVEPETRRALRAAASTRGVALTRCDSDCVASAAPLPRTYRRPRGVLARDVSLAFLDSARARLRAGDATSRPGFRDAHVRPPGRLDPGRDDVRAGADGATVAGGRARADSGGQSRSQD